MCRIKNLAILLGLCMVITACGSSEQQKSKVMLYQGDKNKKEEEHYKTTKVKKGTYEEKISRGKACPRQRGRRTNSSVPKL